jgi:hypothetical protein
LHACRSTLEDPLILNLWEEGWFSEPEALSEVAAKCDGEEWAGGDMGLPTPS